MVGYAQKVGHILDWHQFFEVAFFEGLVGQHDKTAKRTVLNKKSYAGFCRYSSLSTTVLCYKIWSIA